MFRIPVVGIDDVAGGAAGLSIIAGVIVGARKREQRIKQPRLLQPEEDRIDAQARPQTTIAQLHLRLARQLEDVRTADIRRQPFQLAASFKNAQDIARLSHLPAWQWQQKWKDPFLEGLFGRRRRVGEQRLNLAVFAVAFSIMSVFVWRCAVVV